MLRQIGKHNHYFADVVAPADALPDEMVHQVSQELVEYLAVEIVEHIEGIDYNNVELSELTSFCTNSFTTEFKYVTAVHTPHTHIVLVHFFDKPYFYIDIASTVDIDEAGVVDIIYNTLPFLVEVELTKIVEDADD